MKFLGACVPFISLAKDFYKCMKVKDMQKRITFQALTHSRTDNNSTWINVDYGDETMGFIKGVIDGNTITVEFLHIFKEYRGFGYARKAIDTLRSEFTVIVDENDQWLYKKHFPQMEI